MCGLDVIPEIREQEYILIRIYSNSALHHACAYARISTSMSYGGNPSVQLCTGLREQLCQPEVGLVHDLL